MRAASTGPYETSVESDCRWCFPRVTSRSSGAARAADRRPEPHRLVQLTERVGQVAQTAIVELHLLVARGGHVLERRPLLRLASLVPLLPEPVEHDS